MALDHLGEGPWPEPGVRPAFCPKEIVGEFGSVVSLVIEGEVGRSAGLTLRAEPPSHGRVATGPETEGSELPPAKRTLAVR